MKLFQRKRKGFKVEDDVFIVNDEVIVVEDDVFIVNDEVIK